MSSFSINTLNEKSSVGKFSQIGKDIEGIIRELERFQSDLNSGSLSVISRSLDLLIQECQTNRQDMISLKQSLDEIIKQYEQAERGITGGREDTGLIQKLQEIGKRGLDEIKKNLEDYLKSLKGKDSGACEYGGDPINFSTGNFVMEREYLKMRGHIPLSFALFYNSLETRDGQVGIGWNHNFQISVRKGVDRYVLYCEDGREEIFKRTEQGYLRALLDNGKHMTEMDNQIIVTDSHGITSVFDSDGRIKTIKVGHAGALAFSYDALGRLEKVQSTSGEQLRYTYRNCTNGFRDSAGEAAESGKKSVVYRLIKVTDHTGRSVRLSYKESVLTEIVDELGNLSSFGYDKNDFLTTVRNAMGVATIRNEYDGTGRVVRQHYPDGGMLQLTYDRDQNILHVTEQNGNQIAYVQDELYRNVETVYSNGKITTAYDHRNRKTSRTDKKGNTTNYSYDLSGRLSEITNPLGEKMQFAWNENGQIAQVRLCDRVLWTSTYDESGNLTARADALGRTSRLFYNAYGKPVKIIQPDSSEILLDYDDRGNISRIQAPFGGTVCYEYDDYGNVTASIDGNGNRTEYRYNDRGFLSHVKNAENNTREYSYNAAGLVTRIKDFDGSEIKREYNDVNKLSKETNQVGNITEYIYDCMFNVVSRKEGNGAQFCFEYDMLHRLTGITNPLGGHITYEYDENDNQIGVIDDQGGEIRCEYDSLDRLICVTDADGSVSRTQYNEMGQPVRITDACGNVRREEYDAAGQKIRTTDVTGNVTTYSYDQMGNMTDFVDAAGRTTVFEYLPGGLLKKAINPDGTFFTYEYDKNRNVICRTDQKGYFLLYEYDCMNRIVAVSDSGGLKKRFEYNALGQVSRMTDANGGITNYTYTAVGKLASVTDPLGNCTWYSYDNMGFMTDVWQEDGQKAEQQICRELDEIRSVNAANERRHLIHYERNCMGQMTKSVDALGNTEQFTYDRNGKLTGRIDPEGNQFTYAYTAGGMLSEVLCADGKSVELSYNPLKQLIQIKDWLGTTRIDNDPVGRPIRIQDSVGHEVLYKRGILGEREAVSYPGGKQIKYHYDELRRLISMDSDEGQYGFTYDENGRLHGRSYPNGIWTKYAYDISGRLMTQESLDRDGVLDHFSYAYDPMGNTALIEKRRRNLSNESGQYRYIYDACRRLIQTEKDGETIESYGYDGFGNRSYSVTDGRRTEYTYDYANQMIRSVAGDMVTEYQYDTRGNLIELSENRKRKKVFRYDSFNHMSACMGEEKSVVYDYNGFGHRVSARIFDMGMASDGVIEADGIEKLDVMNSLFGMNRSELYPSLKPIETREYLYDLTGSFGNLLEERVGEHTTAYVWNGDMVASVAGRTVRFYLHDAVGSPLRTTDSDGTVKESFDWDPFGNNMMESSGNDPFFGFAGFLADPVAGMYITKQRGYLPEAGRFAARDTLSGLREYPYTLNAYSYCWNRPLDLVDYDGAFPSFSDIESLIRHTVDSVTDGVKDAWDVGVGYVREGTKAVFNTANYLYQTYIPEDVQGYISEGGQWILRTGRSLVEADVFGGYSISDGWAWLTKSEAGTVLLDMVSFTRTSDGVYHAKQDCWQAPFGYNDFYDYVFDGATSCGNRKFPFISDGTKYTIWMWKGDYVNLGAGCETGIYYSDKNDPNSYHMYSATDTGIRQTISLRDKRTGELIFEYDPGEPAWWITGFNPEYQDINKDDLVVSGSICFADNPALWDAFYKQYKDKGGWCFDTEKKTVYYTW